MGPWRDGQREKDKDVMGGGGGGGSTTGTRGN